MRLFNYITKIRKDWKIEEKSENKLRHGRRSSQPNGAILLSFVLVVLKSYSWFQGIIFIKNMRCVLEMHENMSYS